MLNTNSGQWLLLDWKEKDAAEKGHMRFSNAAAHALFLKLNTGT